MITGHVAGQADVEAEQHAHRHEQFRQVRAAANRANLATDHDGAAARSREGRRDPRLGPRGVSSLPTNPSTLENGMRTNRRQNVVSSEAVAGAVRRLRKRYRVMSVSRRYMPILPTNMARFAPATAGCRTARTSTSKLG